MQRAFRHSILFLTALLLFSHAAFSQKNTQSNLPNEIRNDLKSFEGKVGVGVLGLDFKDTILINEEMHYAMQSVYKVPLAIYILHRVEQGSIKMDQVVHIQKNKLDAETWSPMLKDFTQQNFDLTVSDLLRYAVSKSDNNACDLLFALAGGTKAVHEYFQKSDIRKMAIAATEGEMHAKWETQYSNWCQPSAMLQVLARLYNGSWLNKPNTELLLHWMTETENSPNRIKGKLPKGTIVAHKTGTSFSEKGKTFATNDVGIITLPNGQHYALVVYLMDYKGDVQKGEELIADISKSVWDYYSQ